MIYIYTVQLFIVVSHYISFPNREFYQKLNRTLMNIQRVDTQNHTQTVAGQSFCGLGDRKGNDYIQCMETVSKQTIVIQYMKYCL